MSVSTACHTASSPQEGWACTPTAVRSPSGGQHPPQDTPRLGLFSWSRLAAVARATWGNKRPQHKFPGKLSCGPADFAESEQHVRRHLPEPLGKAEPQASVWRGCHHALRVSEDVGWSGSQGQSLRPWPTDTHAAFQGFLSLVACSVRSPHVVMASCHVLERKGSAI